MRRFREFVRTQPFKISLREEEAAPTPTAAPPSSPETTNTYHFDSLQRELGIDDAAFKGALEGGIHTLYKVPEYGWGFRVQPPIQAMVKDKGSDQYEVTFMLTQKKLMNPKSFVYPYSTGHRPHYYEGEVEDKTETMNKEELADLIVPPLESGGMGGGMGGMMGPPGMGGPMGAPMGGPMGGGPPPGGPLGGGMPPIGGM